MSKVSNLIKKLCSSGVKYYRLSTLEDNGYIKLGRGNVISKEDIRNNPGDYPVYSSSAVGNGEIGRYGKYMFDDIRISWSIDGGGRFFYRDDSKYSITNVSGWLKVLDENFIMPKYIYYALVNEWTKKTYNYNHKAHPSVIRKEYCIPVPPMEIQKEIVRTLDKFYELEADLEAELEAELEARKQQYEFWRDKIFEEESKENLTKFSEFSTVQRGGNFQKKDYVEEGKPCIHYGQIYMNYDLCTDKTLSFISENVYYNQKFAHKNDLIMAITSENIEDVCKTIAWLGKEDVAVSGHSAIISHNQNPKYLAYYFQSNLFQKQKVKYARGVKVVEFQPSKLANIEVPIPSMKRQEEIVLKLDKMYTLTHSFVEGISAEIELRRKQYEYYRNKLLSFKELIVNE